MMSFLTKPDTHSVLCDFLLFKGEDSHEDKLKYSYQVLTMLARMVPYIREENGACKVGHVEQEKLCLISLEAMIERLPEAFEPDFEGSLHHVLILIENWMQREGPTFYKLLDESPDLCERYINGFIRALWFSRTPATFTSFVSPDEPELVAKIDGKLRGELHFFARLTQTICDTSEALKVRIGAADFFPCILEKLCTYGGIVLELKESPGCIADLIQLMCNENEPLDLRRSVCSCLEMIITMSRQPLVSVGMNRGTGKPILESCRLAACREAVFQVLGENLSTLCNALEASDSSRSGPQAECKYSSYVVRQPFSYHRYMLVKVVVAVAVDGGTEVLDKFPTEAVRKLCQWFLKYPHNNLFHTQFVKFFAAVIQQGDGDHPLAKFMLQKCKILTKFIDALTSETQEHDGQPAVSNGTGNQSSRGCERLDVSGHVLQLLNLVREKSRNLSQQSYLCAYLRSHDSWRSFEPHLDKALEIQALDVEILGSNNADLAGTGELQLPTGNPLEANQPADTVLLQQIDPEAIINLTHEGSGSSSPQRQGSRKSGKGKKKKQRKKKSKSGRG